MAAEYGSPPVLSGDLQTGRAIMKKRRLSSEQAFVAMSIFLERYSARTAGGDVRALLGDIQISRWDGLPFDPAARTDWLEAVEAALQDERHAAELAATR